jgi:hypothetical protein
MIGTHHRGRRAPDSYDYILFLPGIWMCCGLSVLLRLIGPAFVVIPVGCCILFGLLRRVMPPRALGIYLAFCVLVGILSAFHVFPESWQRYFLPDAIVRQLIPVLGVFAVAWGSKTYFLRRIGGGGVFLSAPVVLMLSIVVAPLLTYAGGLGYEGDYSLYANLAEWGSFLNNMVITFFFLSGAVFFNSDWRRYTALGFMFLVCFMSHFAQFKILTAITLAGLIGVPMRALVMSAVVGFVGIYGIGLNYVAEMLHQDSNDGLRLVFISDVFRSMADTSGLGIGYGRESVRWRYHFPGLPDFSFLPDPTTMSHARMLEALSTGVHNSFAQALLRSGVPGLMLLVFAMIAAFPSHNVPRNVRNHAASLFAIMFVACFVNPALESPAQVVGIGFVYGYLLALNACARRGDVRIRWSGRWRPSGSRKIPRVPPGLGGPVLPGPFAPGLIRRPDIASANGSVSLSPRLYRALESGTVGSEWGIHGQPQADIADPRSQPDPRIHDHL